MFGIVIYVSIDIVPGFYLFSLYFLHNFFLQLLQWLCIWRRKVTIIREFIFFLREKFFPYFIGFIQMSENTYIVLLGCNKKKITGFWHFLPISYAF